MPCKSFQETVTLTLLTRQETVANHILIKSGAHLRVVMVRVGLGDGACLSTIQITEKLQWFAHNADVKVTRPQTDLNIFIIA